VDFDAPPGQSHGPSLSNQLLITMGKKDRREDEAQSLYSNDCPEGLEYLKDVSEIKIEEEASLLETLVAYETGNEYKIKNDDGQTVYTAEEDSGCLCRNCCGPIRPFEMRIKDGNGREVINMHRPYRCTSCVYLCFLQSMKIKSSITGETLGKISQKWHPIYPRFSIMDGSFFREEKLQVHGPFWTMSCLCQDIKFQILDTEGNEIGEIYKERAGILEEAFTDADHFCCKFPKELDVKLKAALMGMAFLIDFMYFESTRNEEAGNSDGYNALCCLYKNCFKGDEGGEGKVR